MEEKWGSGIFNTPHMLTIASDGSVWITDVGKHQARNLKGKDAFCVVKVFKFSPKGELLMTLGEAFVPGSDQMHFCAPTQVAVLLDGSILVSDGYCNKRIMKFNSNGGEFGISPIMFIFKKQSSWKKSWTNL